MDDAWSQRLKGIRLHPDQVKVQEPRNALGEFSRGGRQQCHEQVVIGSQLRQRRFERRVERMEMESYQSEM